MHSETIDDIPTTAAEAGGALPADQARALGELERIIGFHISLAEVAIKAHFQRNYGDALGLTQKQIAVLWLVDSCPGIIQVDLARLLRVQRATISAVVNILTARGLMSRAGPGPEDARHVPLELTQEGRRVLAEAKGGIERHENWVKQHLTAAEQKTVISLMGKLYRDGE